MENRINFNIQYSTSYSTRFAAMKKLILQNNSIDEYALPIKVLSENLKDESIVIATLFLASGLKHSVLSHSENNINQATYISDDALLFIEDETGKIEIKFAHGFKKLKAYSSGMVLGFVGKTDSKNIFECTDVIFPIPLAINKSVGKGKVLLVSNCLIKQGNLEKLKIITDIYNGKFDELVIIGDVFDDITYNNINKWVNDCKVKINLIPGLNDPTSLLIPQAPLHEKFFTADSSENKLRLLPNPCQTRLLSNNFVFISHHIVHDIAKYIPQHFKGVQNTNADYRMHLDEKNLESIKPVKYFDDEDIIGILKQIVQIRHLAPNAPDTIGCIPYMNEDPFLLNDFDYLITGGFDNAIKKEYNGKYLAGIPDFDKTGKTMLLDLSDGSFEEIECLEL